MPGGNPFCDAGAPGGSGERGSGRLAAPSPWRLRTLGPDTASAPGQWLTGLPTGHPAWAPVLSPARRTHRRAAPSVAPSQLGYPSASSYPCCREHWGRTPAHPSPLPQRGLPPSQSPRGPRRPGRSGRPPTICGPSRPPAAPAQVRHPSRLWAPHKERDAGSSGQAVLPSRPGPSGEACLLKASLSSCRRAEGGGLCFKPTLRVLQALHPAQVGWGRARRALPAQGDRETDRQLQASLPCSPSLTWSGTRARSGGLPETLLPAVCSPQKRALCELCREAGASPHGTLPAAAQSRGGAGTARPSPPSPATPDLACPGAGERGCLSPLTEGRNP